MKIREYTPQDLPEMIQIWNEVVADGEAFPQEEFLDLDSGQDFFRSQSYTGVAIEDENVLGLYILHPNNIGRCGHIGNASYAVKSEYRDKHVGEALVKDSIEQGRRVGFRILQFNAVVMSNERARHLYERLGFKKLGVIPKGFRIGDHYEDNCLYYYEL